MWDSRLVTTLRLAPDCKFAEDIVVRKITKKVFEDHDDQELYHKETLAWVPEGTSAKDLNLMTAAPELLEALKLLTDPLYLAGLNQSAEHHPFITKAHAAITKATKEQP